MTTTQKTRELMTRAELIELFNRLIKESKAVFNALLWADRASDHWYSLASYHLELSELTSEVFAAVYPEYTDEDVMAKAAANNGYSLDQWLDISSGARFAHGSIW